MEDYGRKELKQVKKRQNWQKSMKRADSGWIGRPSQSTVSGRSSASQCWPLALLRQLSRNQTLFLFSALQKRGNLAYSILDFLGYIRMTRTHLGEDGKSKIEERVKKKRRASG